LPDRSHHRTLVLALTVFALVASGCISPSNDTVKVGELRSGTLNLKDEDDPT